MFELRVFQSAGGYNGYAAMDWDSADLPDEIPQALLDNLNQGYYEAEIFDLNGESTDWEIRVN